MVRPLFVGSQVSHPPPTKKMHLPEFCHYAIISFCACARRDPTLFGAGSGDDTRMGAALHGICRCVMYCWAAWYVVVLPSGVFIVSFLLNALMA